MSEVQLKDTVSAIMTKDVKTLSSTETMRTALRRMVQEDISSIIVTKDDKALGILTERDMARISVTRIDHSFFEDNIGTYMKTPLVTVEPDTSIWSALELMVDNNIRRLPVVKERKLLGIISEKDIVFWILKVAYEPDIPPYLKKLIVKLEKQEKL